MVSVPPAFRFPAACLVLLVVYNHRVCKWWHILYALSNTTVKRWRIRGFTITVCAYAALGGWLGAARSCAAVDALASRQQNKPESDQPGEAPDDQCCDETDVIAADRDQL